MKIVLNNSFLVLNPPERSNLQAQLKPSTCAKLGLSQATKTQLTHQGMKTGPFWVSCRVWHWNIGRTGSTLWTLWITGRGLHGSGFFRCILQVLYGILVCKLNELLGLFFCVTHVLRATPEHYIVMRRRSLITSPASGFNFVADLCRYLIGFQTCIPAFELKEYGSLAIESKSVYLSLTFIYPNPHIATPQ